MKKKLALLIVVISMLLLAIPILAQEGNGPPVRETYEGLEVYHDGEMVPVRIESTSHHNQQRIEVYALDGSFFRDTTRYHTNRNGTRVQNRHHDADGTCVQNVDRNGISTYHGSGC